MKAILKLLSNKGFISYNKIIAKTIGVYEAILLGELCSLMEWSKEDEFYCSQQRISEDTSLSLHQIREAMDKLKNEGIVEVIKKGCPCKNYYRINDNVLLDIFKIDEKKKTPDDVSRIKQEYMNNYKKLYEKGVLVLEEPAINWSAANKLIKEAVQKVGYENVITAIRTSIENDFCVKKGYSLTLILSNGVLMELLNNKMNHEKFKPAVNPLKNLNAPDKCPSCGGKVKLALWGGGCTVIQCTECKNTAEYDVKKKSWDWESG